MTPHPITEHAVAHSHRMAPKQRLTTDPGGCDSSPTREDSVLIATAFCSLVAWSLSSQVSLEGALNLTSYPSYSNVIKMRHLIPPLPRTSYCCGTTWSTSAPFPKHKAVVCKLQIRCGLFLVWYSTKVLRFYENLCAHKMDYIVCVIIRAALQALSFHWKSVTLN